MTELLFTYGTLQNHDIQRAIFGRLLDGQSDILEGYRKEWIDLNANNDSNDEEFIYPIAVYSGCQEDAIEGFLYRLTFEELLKADDYEGDSYQRTKVTLKSGTLCWIYEKRV